MRENTQGLQRYIWYGSSLYGHLRDTICLPLFKTKKLPSRSSLLLFLFLLFFVGAFTAKRFLDTATLTEREEEERRVRETRFLKALGSASASSSSKNGQIWYKSPSIVELLEGQSPAVDPQSTGK